MSFSHLAITTKDMVATHRFYTEAVGFTLAKVDVLDLPGGGWARHAFYDTGDRSLLAVLEPHDDSFGEFRTDLSTGLGLPSWANHIAFGVADFDALEGLRRRLLDRGHGCVVMDHHEAIALYTDDPNGIVVEFSVWVRPFFTAENRRRAAALIDAESPAVTIGEPPMEFFDPAPAPAIGSDIIERARAVVGAAAYASS
jgi:catechol 2,3-dioxygenase-like lactoylglutathione lyase family enzyme